MNQQKFYPDIRQFIISNSGKVSFCITLLLILFLDAIKLITFDSIMPYLTGIGIWAILWQQCARSITPPLACMQTNCQEGNCAYSCRIIKHYDMP